MSARLSIRQNQIRLVAVFVFTVLLALAFQFYKANVHSRSASLNVQAKQLDDHLFIGLRHATPAEIHAALPEAVGKPTLVDFGSKLCHDCKRMLPVLSELLPKHPQIYFRKIDVLEDQKKYPALFRTFKPVSVPMLVFISPNGEIRNVLYNYQKPETIANALAALAAIEQPSRLTASPKKK